MDECLVAVFLVHSLVGSGLGILTLLIGCLEFLSKSQFSNDISCLYTLPASGYHLGGSLPRFLPKFKIDFY